MPHVHIQHYPRNFTEEQRRAVDAAITRAVMTAFETGEETISIALEPIEPDDWTARVLDRIEAREDLLLKAPAYWKRK
ncbi:tautomerase family protein [Streptomyces sp. DT24]|uniref:tautomerase family protein n=1 Tax=unclassified Streptomyces TaxID=2593676 RepID=UPI0023BA143B|nr:tautomerase family protein [Streptomyces sp. AM 4-1-1]WEH34868.1 tautomerase family protein [Streptomyces sp. AM 4-1-1]